MNLFKRVAIPLAILALVGLTGCDGSSDPAATLGSPEGLQTADMQVFAYEDALMAAGDATLEGPMGFPADLPMQHHFRHGPHAGPPLRALELDEEQRELVMAAFQSYRECLRGPLETFREANREILQQAEQMRQEILEELHNEVIEREEALMRLHELSRATREAIRNSPASAVLHEAICDCRQELFEAIDSVLDDEQQEAWDRWVARHQGECVGT